mgnify:CR=1 FL=1
MSSRITNENHTESERFICPECQSDAVITIYQAESFRYGSGDEAADLTCRIPVRSCKKCGFQFTDDEAEEIRHDTICKHLGVLTPNEIVSIRKRYSLSIADLARLTRIGEASISRWENGHVIQNAANDQLLRLLRYPENLERLKKREEGAMPVAQQLQPASAGKVTVVQSAFRALKVTEYNIAAANAFNLRPANA